VQELEEQNRRLEAEVERLRVVIYRDRAAFRRFRNCAQSPQVREDSMERLAKTNDALDGAEDGQDG